MAAATLDEEGALLEFTFLNGEMSHQLSRPEESELVPQKLKHVSQQVHDFSTFREWVGFATGLRHLAT